MATDYTTLSAIADTLKEVYGKGVTNQFAEEKTTYNTFPKSDRQPKGLGYIFSIRYSRNQGTGVRAESGKLPDALVMKPDKGTISAKHVYGSLRITGPMIDAAAGDEAAFVDGLSDQMDDIYQSLVVDCNRMANGDSYGLLATLSAVATLSTSATWSIACDNDTGMQYLIPGQLVDFFNGTAADQSATACRVLSVDRAAKTAVMEANAGTYKTNHPNSTFAAYTIANGTISSGSLLVKMGVRSATHATTDSTYNEIEGLQSIFDDGTLKTTFENISTSTYPMWKANVLGNSSVNRELSIDLMLQALDLTRVNGGAVASQIRMGLGQRRKYFNLLSPDIRYQPRKLTGGYETLAFAAGDGECDIMVDPYNAMNKMFFQPKDVIKKYELTPIGWGDLDQKFHQRSGYDEYDLFLRLRTNIGCEQRNCLTMIKDLVEPNYWS